MVAADIFMIPPARRLRCVDGTHGQAPPPGLDTSEVANRFHHLTANEPSHVDSVTGTGRVSGRVWVGSRGCGGDRIRTQTLETDSGLGSPRRSLRDRGRIALPGTAVHLGSRSGSGGLGK